MSNLNIENLNRMVQTGNVEQLVGGGMSSGQVASERRVAQEMRTQGMEFRGPTQPIRPRHFRTFSEIRLKP